MNPNPLHEVAAWGSDAGSSMPGRQQADLLPEVIPEGQKHRAIVSLAGTIRRRGASREVAFAACRALQSQSRVSDKAIWTRVNSVYDLYPTDDPLIVRAEPEPGGKDRTIRSVDEIRSIRSYAGSDIDFIVPGILAAGTITAITGDSGTGKTTVVAALCAAAIRRQADTPTSGTRSRPGESPSSRARTIRSSGHSRQPRFHYLGRLVRLRTAGAKLADRPRLGGEM